MNSSLIIVLMNLSSIIPIALYKISIQVQRYIQRQDFYFIARIDTYFLTTILNYLSTNSMDDAYIIDDDLEDDLIDEAVYQTLLAAFQDEEELLRTLQKRYGLALPSKDYLDKLLNSRHLARIHGVLYMLLDTFYALRDQLVVNTSLKASRHVSIEEKLAIFLHLTTRLVLNRDI